jgi:hypothetical protein
MFTPQLVSAGILSDLSKRNLIPSSIDCGVQGLLYFDSISSGISNIPSVVCCPIRLVRRSISYALDPLKIRHFL